MKKINKTLLLLVSAIVLMGSLIFNAEVAHAKIDTSKMSSRASMITGTCKMLAMNGDESGAVDLLIDNYTNGYADDATVAANALVNDGILANHVETLKNAGIPISLSTTTQTPTTEQSAPQPQAKTEFTVTDLEPYTAWATKDCNIRSGADTTYDKAGSLIQYEEVIVNGKAYTGWFRIKTSSGIEAYISDSLLTTEDPNKQIEETTSKEEASTIASSEQVAEEAVVETENTEVETTEQHEHSYLSSVTKEASCTEEGVLTYTCECGDTYDEAIPMISHVEGDWEITIKTSLINNGERVKKCETCGAILETESIPANSALLYALIGIICIVCVGVVVIVKKRK